MLHRLISSRSILCRNTRLDRFLIPATPGLTRIWYHVSLRTHTMNRPRNKQSRPDRGHGGQGRGGSQQRAPRVAYPSSVPNIRQVVPGAAVSIVLKQDQPTGHEVQGVVQDVLTRGDHPRGIKVRLSDGRVGRVQRMASEQSSGTTTTYASSVAGQQINADHLHGPPARSLADFLPADEPATIRSTERSQSDVTTFVTATAVCPICGVFEGDEIAVSHHVETHLT